jgi:predicted double-glycine peptidase
MSDARDTLIIMPSAHPQVISPLAPPRSRASVPVTVVRTLLISLVLYYVLSSSLQLAGRSGLPLAPFPWAAANGSASALAAQASPLLEGNVASRVRPMTQMRRVDLYDSRAQFNQWGGAACSAASLAEVLTAYGLPHMTIGRVIREMGADISPNWGLLTYNAFNKVVSKYGLRADVYLANNPLTYKQMLYLTNTLGIPVLVNMRATTGYYHYLSGGHILVMTGGDSKTIRLTDSSLYYIKSLPLSTYNWMARPRNVVIVPKNFHYTLPH